jgi:hypothetical protein
MSSAGIEPAGKRTYRVFKHFSPQFTQVKELTAEIPAVPTETCIFADSFPKCLFGLNCKHPALEDCGR